MNPNAIRKLPVNLDLLAVKEPDLRTLQRVKEVQIFDNMNNFHQEGLFSTTIFGNIGTEYRNRMFAYVDLGITILHPMVYHAVINLKSFYRQIAEGTVLAVFDPKTKEFVKSNAPEAQTGYNFFIQNILNIRFEKNQSDKRSFLIDLFEKAKKEDSLFLRYLLVLPAGLRDYSVDANGKPQEDEINTFYRKALFQSNIIDPSAVKKAPEVYDGVASGLQRLTLELFEYLKSLLEGKHKLVLGKWLTRKIFNSTRNVASNAIEKSQNINDHLRLGYNECFIGLHQFLRGVVPKSTYEIKTKYIKDIFIENSTHAFLTNAKTLKREEVLSIHIQKDYDMWTSADGIEKVIANMANLDIRHLPITLNKGKHFLGLVYKDGKRFKFFQDIDDLPEGFDKANVAPVTLAEFLYMSVYHLSGVYPGLITRYPITGFGSIFPAYIKLLTTTESHRLEELDANWQPTGNIAYSFPKMEVEFFNTMSVHHSHFAAAGLDLDGDTLSLSMLLSDDAVEEVTNYLNRKEYYINDNGRLNFSSNTDILGAVLAYMT